MGWEMTSSFGIPDSAPSSGMALCAAPGYWVLVWEVGFLGALSEHTEGEMEGGSRSTLPA